MATFADGLRCASPFPRPSRSSTASSTGCYSAGPIWGNAIASYGRAGIRAGGAAASALAALPQLADVAGPVAVIVTGHNIDEELYRRALESPESFPD
jgi:threonine dehydratase